MAQRQLNGRELHNMAFRIEKIKDEAYNTRWTKKFIRTWQKVFLSVDEVNIDVYDEKSDYDNPFVEPLFSIRVIFIEQNMFMPRVRNYNKWQEGCSVLITIYKSIETFFLRVRSFV